MNNSRHIAIVCTSPGYGGLEQNTLLLAVWMRRNGWDVSALVSNKSRLHALLLEADINTTAVQDFKPRLEHATSSLIHRWLRNRHISLLLTPYNKDLKALSLYKRLSMRQVKLVYQQHMMVGIRKRDLIHRLRYAMVDLWICPLPYLKDEVLEKTTIPASRVQVIPLGVPTTPDHAHHDYTKVTARAALDIPAKGQLMGVIGRLDPKKGQDFAIEAMIRFGERFPELRLLIMGSPTAYEGTGYEQALRAQAAGSGVADRIYFRPFRPDTAVFYSAIDLMVMPSHGETYGMVTLESMLYGKPILGADRDGTRALLQEGELGWLYPLNDLDRFGAQLEEILSGTGVTERTTRAYEEVVRRYDLNTCLRRTAEMLGTLVR